MIKVKNLSKNYISKNNNNHLALDDITFNLPSKGMVFIIGKSGSGKSTLLNILGGLDFPTSGKIVVDGNDFDNFNDSDFDNYRNTYLGFIFQDFHLIQEMNVKQNIELALDLQGKKNKKALKEVLEQVELKGFEKRYPSELSGGQQQRVAIARAIIKKPRLILADEPTGNLDSKTSKHILDVLKDLSKNTLVVIVSHNKDDANNYADRIIELSDGKISRDVKRKSKNNFELIEENTINFPHNVRLTQEELATINKKVKSGGYKISQKNDIFEETKQFYEKEKYIKLKPRRIKLHKTIYLANKFTKGQYFHSFLTAFVIACMVILISISQIFASFNSKQIIDDVILTNEDTGFVLQKGYYEGQIYPTLYENKIIRIEDKEIDEYYNKGYEGNIYKLYNKTLPFANALCVSNADSMLNVDYSSTKDLYVKYGRGVLDCDVEFLAKKFGINKEIKLLAGSLDEGFKDNGYVITDYLADAILYHNPKYLLLGKDKAYQTIVDQANINQRFTVKAIISTNYLDRYNDIIEIFLSKTNLDGLKDFEEKLNKIKDTDLFVEFANELNEFLTIGYYIGNQDIRDATFVESWHTNAHISMANTQYFDENNNELTDLGSLWAISTRHGSIVEENEVHVGYTLYNKMFGTEITPSTLDQFVERYITIKRFDVVDEYKENAIVNETFKITKLITTSGHMIFHENDLKELSKSSMVPYALYFDNIDSISSIYEGTTGTDDQFFTTNETFKAVYKIKDVISIFNDLFLIIVTTLCCVSIAFLINFIKKSIDRKKYEIGILRAIGGKNNHLYWIYLYQIILIVIYIFTLSLLGMKLLDNFLNQVLINNLSKFIIADFISDLTIIKFDLKLIIIINGLIFILSLICSISVLLSLRKIKPINIIKAKEL